MGHRWIGFLGALGVAAALAAVLLPFARCVREHGEHERIAAELKVQMEALDGEETEKQWNLARWYNRNLALESPEPGFRAAYDTILNFGQGRMGLLEVPEWNLTLPITHGIGGEAGHDPDTTLPIGGQTVIWLNREYPWTENTEICIEIPGARRYFRVESVQVMPIGWSTASPAGQEMLILAQDSGNRRTIVRCAPWAENIPETQPPAHTLRRAFLWAAVPLLAVLLLSVGRFREKNKQPRGLRRQVLGR